MNHRKLNTTVVLLCFVIGMAILLNSCQKELTGANNTFGCKIQTWSSLTTSGGVAYQFSYAYDSATAKPTQLSYVDSSGFQTTVIPTFKGDTVFFSNNSYAVLDGSKRIKHLIEKSSFSPNGDYYYEYDASGHLVKDTYDNGTTSQIYNATFTGDALTKLTIPYNAVPDAVAFNYTYSDSIKVLGYNYYMMVDNNFNELELYLPCFSVGTFTTKAITQQVISAASPVVTFTPIVTNYTNYTLTGQGYISTVNEVTTGGATFSSSISANYLCK